MSRVFLPEQRDMAELFAQFKPYNRDEIQSGFIRSIKHWCYNNSIHLLSCEFDTAGFTQQCFGFYGISQPDELQNAVQKRKAEFLAGRFVAAQALAALGLSAEQRQVAVAADRAPVWPSGILGSITHTTDFALCCVGKASDISLMGIDSELVLSQANAQNIAAEIHNTTELELLTDAGFGAALATTLIFSAKESLYKALYPKVRCFFGFETARLSRVDSQSHSLTLVLSGSFAAQHRLNTQYKVQFCIKETVVHTLLMQ